MELPVQTVAYPCAFCGALAVAEIIVAPPKYTTLKKQDGTKTKIMRVPALKSWACYDHAMVEPAKPAARKPKGQPPEQLPL